MPWDPAKIKTNNFVYVIVILNIKINIEFHLHTVDLEPLSVASASALPSNSGCPKFKYCDCV